MRGLRNYRVVDASRRIAGAYCSKLFADAGADVVLLEPPGGAPLRRWSATGAELGDQDAPLFRYLHASKRSVTGEIEAADELLASADLLIEDRAPDALDRAALRERHPHLVVLSITPYGLDGPYASHPATDFTLQAEGGSLGGRSRPGQEPYQAGGQLSEWAGGSFGAVAALAAARQAKRSGRGEHIDFSLHAATALVTNAYLDLMWGLLGRPPVAGAFANLETPSIEPIRDGYIGFTTYSAQQMSDFLLMIGRPDLRETGEFDQVAQRMARLEEWETLLHAWTREHGEAEILEQCHLLRIPVAPICDGRSVLEQEQLVARGSFGEDPSKGFQRPLPPYRIDGERLPAARPAPSAGEHDGCIEAREAGAPASEPAGALPLAGLRIVDTTTWWAGPMATHMLGLLGAEVVHVESTKRMDGSRAIGGTVPIFPDVWWESSFIFLSVNSNKRGLALDLGSDEGKAVFARLVENADAVVENFSPRVMDGFGVDWDWIQGIAPRCHYVRMPAFGLDGPWREHVGFAATMEQMAGLSWLTGHVEDQPRIQRGPCDPLAGMHAAFALLVALHERDHDGRGHFVECCMLEAALNVTAEQVAEYTAFGNRMERMGNRSPSAAPQGLYPARGHHLTDDPQWIALSVETDEQWQALVGWLGAPDWTREISADLASRRAAQDRIDAELRAVLAEQERDACIAELLAAGVPAGRVVDPRTLADHPQLTARRFHEDLDHAVVGTKATMGAPFRYASIERWLRSAAPTLGEHNAEVLGEIGLDADEITRLTEAGILGDRPKGL